MTTVSSGQTASVGFAATSSGVIVLSGGNFDILLSGTAEATVDSGGTDTIFSRGHAFDTVVSNGGNEYVSNGGFASSSTVSNGGQQTVFAGGTANATAVDIAGIELISSGGIANDTAVGILGTQDVFSGGAVVGSLISGGLQYVYSGATTTGTTITIGGSDGGTVGIEPGGTEISTIFLGFGLEDVNGNASNTTVQSSGSQRIFSGGIAIGAMVSNGGDQEVNNGGTASNTTIGVNGTQTVVSGGTAIDTTVGNGGLLILNSGGTMNGATVEAGGTLEIVSTFLGSSPDGVTFQPGATLKGGADSEIELFSVTSAIQIEITSGGHEYGLTLSNGAELLVEDHGFASQTTVSDGGSEVILSGANVTSTTLKSGGDAYVYAGAEAIITFASSGSIENIAGTSEEDFDSGFAIVYSGGIDEFGSFLTDGYQYILPGGLASHCAIQPGGIENVDGSATVTFVNGFQIIFSGAEVDTTSVASSGYQYILPGGVADGTTVASGGIQNIDGSATSTTLDGFQIIYSGAVASGNLIQSTGYEYILPGGTANDTTVMSGGIQNVDGTAVGNTISSGGYQIVFSGASAVSTTIDSGGFEVVVSGGVTTSATISGGYVELGGGDGVASGGIITFVSGGEIKFDDSVHFEGKISGFAQPDVFDLADISFGVNTNLGFVEANNNAIGTLTVTDGAHTANILLLGQYTAAQFHIADDGAGGTYVTDPPIIASGSDPPAPFTESRG